MTFEELEKSAEEATRDKAELFDVYDEHFHTLLAIAKAAKEAMRNGDDQGERFVLYRGDASALANALTAFEKNA